MGLFREIKFELSFAILAAGLFMTILGLFWASWSPLLPYKPELLEETFVRPIGGWMVYVTFFGPLLTLGAGWYFIDMVRKRREFERLMATPSKAAFVRSQDRIEYLAWYLTRDHEQRVDEKKKEFKIRT